jgi:hypothetical protein
MVAMRSSEVRLRLVGGLLAAALLWGAAATAAQAAWIWVEGESPVKSTMNRHPWWYDLVKKDQFSGGDFISNFNKDKPGEADYAFEAPEAGKYEFWVRANPLMAKLSYKLNDADWVLIDLGKNQVGNTNVAADGKPDLRFIAWVKVGQAALKKGANTIAFRMHSENSNHGYLDCFVFSTEPFTPMGTFKPDQLAAAQKRLAEENKGWVPFAPKIDPFQDGAAMDLRGLNEKQAGDGGFLAVKDGRFVHSKTGQPVRFWAVNGPPNDTKDRQTLRQIARMLAKHGVNMVRVHGRVCDDNGEVDLALVQRLQVIVEEMKAEGIYTHPSIYFPLWLKPKAGTAWLAGYDGKTVPFAALFFNKDFQKQYQGWWKGLLTTPAEGSGKPLTDEPAVSTVEIINEDSFFFWTFTEKGLPDPELRILEGMFGEWLKKKYTTLDAAFEAWKGLKLPRDAPAEGRVAFRHLWNMFKEKTARDKDTTAFLLDVQRGFYADTVKFLRGLGFKGLVTCSNWTTASAEVFGPIEKYSYTVGDFIDRHGYFGCNEKGDSAEWSMRDGHTYADRSSLRFEPEEPGKPLQFTHPVMDPHYAGVPSMISETTYCRPNRYRTEAMLVYAAYGALQDSDAIVHFALDSATWAVKPGFFMQPWTLMSPAMMGQSPAAAVIYRQGLVAPGDVLVDLKLNVKDMLDLKGTPLPPEAAFDELRLKDVPKGLEIQPGNVIDPLVHLAGRANVTFTTEAGQATLKDLSPFVDRSAKTVTSTTGQVKLDYAKGVMTVNAPAAQAVNGALKAAGSVQLKDLTVTSGMELGCIIAVGLDGKPIAESKRILVQVMSEEKNGNFQTEPVGPTGKQIKSIGQDPWMVKEFQGTLKFKHAGAAALKVTALDFNGYPVKELGPAGEIKLAPDTMYYLIAP